MGWRVSALTYVKSKIITQYSQINPIRQLKDGELNYSTNHFCCESVLQKRISCTFSHKDNDCCKVRKSNYCIKGNHFCFSLSIYRLWTCAHFNSFFEGSDVYQLQKKYEWLIYFEKGIERGAASLAEPFHALLQGLLAVAHHCTRKVRNSNTILGMLESCNWC